MADEVQSEKRALRQQLSSVRAQLAPATRTAETQAVVEALVQSGLLAETKTIATYAAFGPELDLRALETRLKDKTWAYPRVQGDELIFHEALRPMLQPNPPWNIREPDSADPIAKPEVFLVPGLGFTRTGDRIGYGKGFYDRALIARPAVLRIGVCFSAQVVDELPVEPGDAALDFVVTGTGTFETGRR